jgi:dipeptidyl aminopeptidase/acylaminoacyl peptidase
MSTPIIARYGTWHSPLTTSAITAQALGLGALSVDGNTLYWLEIRPQEAGRTVLRCRATDGECADVTPAPISVTTRVYEYGGGAYRVTKGWIVYSNGSDDSVWLIAPNGATWPIAAIPGCRYADFWFDLPCNRVLAVREDHRNRPPSDPEITIVSLRLDPVDCTRSRGEVLVRGPDFLAAPRISPDGTRLAWLEWDQPAMPWDGTRLKLAALDIRGRPRAPIQVAGGPAESILQPLFAPGGDLHFCSDRTNWWNIYSLIDGEVRAIAPVEAETGGPDWLLAERYYSFDEDGQVLCSLIDEGIRRGALIAGRRLTPLDFGPIQGCPVALGQGFVYISSPPDQPLAILYRDSLGGEDIVIARTGPAPLDPSDISVGRPIRFAAGDGSRAHAFFYEPRNSRFAAPAGARPPLLVIAHGGPTAMSTNALSLSIQWWTTRGFAVVDVNYGGSTGFGRAYRQRLNGQWGVVDVEDCVAAALYLADVGKVDARCIAITGASAGGFTALAALAASDLFRAGGSHFGMADPIQFRTETHKFEARYLDSLIGPLPEAAPLYHRRSPLTNAGRITVPVILFQGQDDKIVPPSLTDAIAEALAAQDRPFAHYVFAGEGHGFRKAETIRRVLNLELSFYSQIFGFTPLGLEERVVPGTWVEPAPRTARTPAND